MRIGLDLDNTIIDYHELFYALAVEQGWMPAGAALPKSEVRDTLRGQPDGETTWRRLQAMVYGERILDARLASGAREFICRCVVLGIEVYVVSHKTQFPSGGEDIDLHEAARAFLLHHQIAPGTIPLSRVFFEPTRTAKAARLEVLGCTHFVDDLPEMFAHETFPEGVERILYRSVTTKETGPWDFVESFPMIRQRLLADLEMETFTVSVFGSKHDQCELLSGGRNSRVHRLTWNEGRSAICKQYMSDGRGRLDAEVEALAFMATAGINCIPRILGVDGSAACLLLEDVQGKAITAENVGPADMNALYDFLAQLTASGTLPEAKRLASASEACFCGADYARACWTRLGRLRKVNDSKLSTFLDVVEKELERVEKGIREGYAQARLDYNAPLRADQLIPSPSDLGFHNALRRTDGSIIFLDFEFFGLDDPAKLTADTLYHPQMELPSGLMDDFTVRAAQSMGDGQGITQRVELVSPLVGLKWCLLLLNEFLTPELARRQFAGVDASGAERILTKQLKKARAMFARVQRERNSHA